MGLQRQVQSIALSAAFLWTGNAFAQQNVTGVNDQSNLQHQRLNGTADMNGTTGNVTGRATNPNTNGADVNATMMDYGGGTDMGNQGHFVTMSDKQFAQSLTSRGMLEMQLSQIAVDRGGSADVKQLAQRILDDYTRWTTGMHRASNALDIKLPTHMDAKQKAAFDRISALSGPEFDQAYLKEMLTLQTRALTLAQYEADKAGVGGFRHFAGVMVPQIQDQMRMARASLASQAPTAHK